MNQRRSKPQLASAIIGALLFITSMPCVIAMIHDLIVGADNLSGALIAGTFFLGLGALGVVMFWYGAIHKADGKAVGPVVEEVSDEKKILRVARDHGGKVTISDVVVETDLSVDEAEALLNRLEMQNVTTSHLSSSGQLVYEFGGFLTNKNRAIDPLSHAVDEVVFDVGEDSSSTETAQASASVHEASSHKK